MQDEISATPGNANEPDDAHPGANVTFPFDRMTVEQFRRRFPRARWSDIRQAWFIPGRTASRRFGKWLAEREAGADAHADAKGRDAFDFDPINSSHLEPGKAGFGIKTPYSKTVVDKLREVPFSRRDGDLKIWHVPYRAFEDLRQRWPQIEAAARRNEPEERRRRAAEQKGSEAEMKSKLRSMERRRRRYPLVSGDLPPIGRVVAISYGLVVFTDITGELVEPAAVAEFYPGVTDDHVWGLWRKPTLDELVRTWPSKTARPERAQWWIPTIDELRPARRVARSREVKAVGSQSGS